MNQLTTSLWGDESFTAVAVQQNFSRMLEIVTKDTAPPLYYLLLFVWTRIFGTSEIAIRSLSVLLYLGTIFLIFLIAKKIWGQKTGLLAIFLGLTNPFLFPFAFEGRMYSLLVFTVTLSFYFFITGSFWGYILAAALAIYSHHYAFLALAVQFLWRLVETVRKPGFLKRPGLYIFNFLKPYLIVCLFYLPWLYPLYQQLTRVAGGFWLGKPSFKDLLGLFFRYFVGDKLIFNWQKYLLILPVLILGLKKWRDKMKENLLLLGWCLSPVILAFLFSQGKTSVFYDRYLIFIIPAISLLLAGGWRRISLILIICFVLPLLYLNFYYFTHPTKRPFRELAQFVKKETTASDLLINFNGKAHHLWESKYYGLKAPLWVPEGDLPYFVGTAQMTETDIIKKLPQKEKIGVISSEEPETMKIPDFTLKSFIQFDSLFFSWFSASNAINQP